MEPTKATESLPPNPKQAYGDKKPNLALVPPALEFYAALALGDGHIKYKMFNWRLSKVEALTYVAAIKRHLDRWVNRIETSEVELWEKDGVTWQLGGHPELAHVAACVAILADAETGGFLIDNRPPANPFNLEKLAVPRVIAEGVKVELGPDLAGYMTSAENRPEYTAGPSERLGDAIARSAEKRETICGHCARPGRMWHADDCPVKPPGEPLTGLRNQACSELDEEFPLCECPPDKCRMEEYVESSQYKWTCVKRKQAQEAGRFDVV